MARGAVQALGEVRRDRAHVDDYVRQVEESRALLYAACDRLGLGYWKSAANFVLVSVGDLVITGAWTRATPNGAKIGGGYLTIENKGTSPDR